MFKTTVDDDFRLLIVLDDKESNLEFFYFIQYEITSEKVTALKVIKGVDGFDPTPVGKIKDAIMQAFLGFWQARGFMVEWKEK